MKPKRFQGHDLDLLGSRDIIGHWSRNGLIYLVKLKFNQQYISHGFRGMEPQIFRDHDLCVLGLRDVIGHVTSGLAIHDCL